MSDTEQEYLYFFVRCKSCGDYHYTDKIHIDDIEEDIQGRDLVYFNCPNTNNTSSSLIYKGHPTPSYTCSPRN